MDENVESTVYLSSNNFEYVGPKAISAVAACGSSIWKRVAKELERGPRLSNAIVPANKRTSLSGSKMDSELDFLRW